MYKHKNKINNFWWIIPTVILVFIVFLDNSMNLRILTVRNPANKFGFSLNNYDFAFFVGILSLIGFSVRQKQKLVAEQIAKSRIDWLKVTRGYISEYMGSIMAYWIKSQWRDYQTKILFDSLEKVNLDEISGFHKETIEDTEKFLMDERSSLEELYLISQRNYYKFFYSVNGKEKIAIFVKQLQLLSNSNIKMNYQLAIELEEIVSSVVQKYFKHEWDKAKYEIETGHVSTKDELKNEKFVKIISEFESMDFNSSESKRKNIKEESGQYVFSPFNKIELEYINGPSSNASESFTSFYDKESDEYKLLKVINDIYIYTINEIQKKTN